MSVIARIGDRTFGTCSAHKSPIPIGGTIVSGSSTTVDGPPIARIGDSVATDCGHSGTIVSGAGTTVDGPPVARLGDSVAGVYNASIISGSSTSTAQ